MSSDDLMILGRNSGLPMERKFCNTSWIANVPQKIEVVAWKVATYSLVVSTCSISGTEGEDGFHALINCGNWKVSRTRAHTLLSFGASRGDFLKILVWVDSSIY
jgi:hypothetical protein